MVDQDQPSLPVVTPKRLMSFGRTGPANQMSDRGQQELFSRRSMSKTPARPLTRAVNPEYCGRCREGGPIWKTCHAAAISRYPWVAGQPFRGLHTSQPVGSEPGIGQCVAPLRHFFFSESALNSESQAECCAVRAAAARQAFSAQQRQTNQLRNRMRQPPLTEFCGAAALPRQVLGPD